MAGSIFGNIFKISTWGESHGKALGVVIDGCPAGIKLSEEDIQGMLDRRKPGTSQFATKRVEYDHVEIMSGVFEGVTTGTPISLVVFNHDQRSKDYSNIKDCYRPGHADYVYDEKYGFRDYRGGGRSSGRETVARVAAGAVAKKILQELGIKTLAYTYSIGDVEINKENFLEAEIYSNTLAMPDKVAYEKAAVFLEKCIKDGDSSGGVVECVVEGLFPGIGQPVFDKLDAQLGKALFSIGAVKAVEIGNGTEVSKALGSQNNDEFYYDEEKVLRKYSNNSGGILGGMSDGFTLNLKAHFKPTSSIYKKQNTVTRDKENVEVAIEGRHDPIIVARAVVVVESMVMITLVDLIFANLLSKMDVIKKVLKNN